MKLDDDKEAVAILQNGIGAYNNRARAIYNKGYQQGLKDGKREAIEMLMQNIDTMKAEQTENSSEIPNNCEHITEDGVTCAKYPACDDCLDNPLNKVKGSERLVKGSEQTEPTISKMEQVEKPQTCDTCKYGEDKHRYAHICNECGVGINNYEPKTEPQFDKDINVRSKDEPQTERSE